MNIYSIIFSIGLGLANTTRTKTGIALGEGKKIEARKFALTGLIYAIMFSISLSVSHSFIKKKIFLIVFRNKVAAFYTPVNETFEVLNFMQLFESFNCIFSATNATISTILRIIGKSFQYSFIMIFDQILIWDGLSILFLFVFSLGGAYVMQSSSIAISITATLTQCIIIRFDWNTIVTLIEKNNQQKQAKILKSRSSDENIMVKAC